MDATRNAIAEYDFLFKDAFVAILTGEYEGIFGWIAVNYILQMQYEPVAVPVAAAKRDDVAHLRYKHTVVDMGGQSLEITLEDNQMHDPYVLKLGEERLNVNTHMFPNGGSNQALRDYFAALQENQTALDIPSPCAPLGYNLTFPHVPPKHDVVLYGTSEPLACAQVCEQVALKNIVADVPLPSLASSRSEESSAYGIGTFSFFYPYVPDLRLAENAYFTLRAFEENAYQYCARTWREIRNDTSLPAPRTQRDDDYRPTTCMKMVYGVRVLRRLGASANTTLIMPSHIKGIAASWSYGAALFNAGLLSWSDYCVEATTCVQCRELRGCGWCSLSNECVTVVNDREPSCPAAFLASNITRTDCQGMQDAFFVWSLLSVCICVGIIVCFIALHFIIKTTRKHLKNQKAKSAAEFQLLQSTSEIEFLRQSRMSNASRVPFYD